ncbi:MAG: hypothetical protein P8164_04980 [Gammaproteobacteria bacterium]|jgi:hypothetical protein
MAEHTNANATWTWGIRYVATIVVVLVLAALLGSMDLFSKTTIAKKALSATKLVHFIGYGAALATFWMFGQHLSAACRQYGGRWAFLQHLILPAVTLIVISASYYVVLPVVHPFMNHALRDVYKWVFILAMLACSIWLVAAVLGQSNSLTEALVDGHRKT